MNDNTDLKGIFDAIEEINLISEKRKKIKKF